MYIFDTACGTSLNKKKTPHANQFALFLVKVSCLNTSKYWFRRFKAGDFDVSDRSRFGTLQKLEADNLQGLLNENPSQTQEELAERLGID